MKCLFKEVLLRAKRHGIPNRSGAQTHKAWERP